MTRLYTDEQWHMMVNACISQPRPLAGTNLYEPWVYYRPWGLMFVPSGYHQAAMATLFAFHHGHLRAHEYAATLGIKAYRANEELADRFLMELDGTAFKSSVGSKVTTGRMSSLNAIETGLITGLGIGITSIE